MSENNKVVLLSDKEVNWGFDNNGPSFSLRFPVGNWNHPCQVDPFPCYHHNIDLVESHILQAETAYKISRKINWYVLPYEFVSRTNGFHTICYSEEKSSLIALSGKRIPIHPAMTKYLVWHEYGHAIFQYLKDRMFTKTEAERAKDLFLNRYAEIRGIERDQGYGSLKWHNNTEEIFCNDFRVIIGNIEPDFWPHDVKFPLDNPEIVSYWKDVLCQWRAE